MFIEHVIYCLALAVVLTCFIRREFVAWGTLIILVSGCIPDIDGIIDIAQNRMVFLPGQLLPRMAEHSRDFHSIGGLVIYTVLIGIILMYTFRLKLQNRNRADKQSRTYCSTIRGWRRLHRYKRWCSRF